MKDSGWKEAMIEEMKSLQKMQHGKWLIFQLEKNPWDVNEFLQLNTKQIVTLKDLKLDL